MRHTAECDLSGVDSARIAAVVEALGPRRLTELVVLLETRMRHLIAAIELLPAGAASLVAALHQSRGSAASLGLTALADALTAIEVLIASNDAIEPASLASVKQAGHALQDRWRIAADALKRHVPDIGLDHAPGVCNR